MLRNVTFALRVGGATGVGSWPRLGTAKGDARASPPRTLAAVQVREGGGGPRRSLLRHGGKRGRPPHGAGARGAGAAPPRAPRARRSERPGGPMARPGPQPPQGPLRARTRLPAPTPLPAGRLPPAP